MDFSVSLYISSLVYPCQQFSLKMVHRLAGTLFSFFLVSSAFAGDTDWKGHVSVPNTFPNLTACVPEPEVLLREHHGNHEYLLLTYPCRPGATNAVLEHLYRVGEPGTEAAQRKLDGSWFVAG